MEVVRSSRYAFCDISILTVIQAINSRGRIKPPLVTLAATSHHRLRLVPPRLRTYRVGVTAAIPPVAFRSTALVILNVVTLVIISGGIFYYLGSCLHVGFKVGRVEPAKTVLGAEMCVPAAEEEGGGSTKEKIVRR